MAISNFSPLRDLKGVTKLTQLILDFSWHYRESIYTSTYAYS